jgi:transposase
MAPLPPWPLRAPPSAEVFRAYVAEVLCPSLRPGDLVIMDNLAPHKSDPTLELITAAGAQVLFLPAYSPDFNPIELAFAKVKARLRAAELRTIDKIGAFFGRVQDEFPPGECRNYLRHCGYAARD